MSAPPNAPAPPSRRPVLPVVGPVTNVEEARMLEKMVLLYELRDRLSPSSRRRR